ncbi:MULTISPECIES: PaaI family thioesterase [Streptococcus]|uniref:PaaI family thioesterase n=1 Tax=Streptococcus caledonicus TaxID=2614158 RepID=A0ABW0UBD0_9STRE|nr:PaaI family thioesterase [Streptococcus sp. S784/96/1]
MDILLHEIRVFENYEVKKAEAGHIIVDTKVVDGSLNYYGNAHGGYLFTLCDQISGLVSRSLGANAVTLQSNINYLRAAHLGDVLTVEGRCIHNGRTTKIVDTVVANDKGDVITKASFTMFVTDKPAGDA